MNEALLEEWTGNVYNKRPGALFQQPTILIMDSATSHKKETVNAKARRCQVTCVKIMSEAASLLFYHSKINAEYFEVTY